MELNWTNLTIFLQKNQILTLWKNLTCFDSEFFCVQVTEKQVKKKEGEEETIKDETYQAQTSGSLMLILFDPADTWHSD